jgi:hypothetical protein
MYWNFDFIDSLINNQDVIILKKIIQDNFRKVLKLINITSFIY